MQIRSYQDIIGGGVLVGIGAFTLIYAATRLRLGTVLNMGPGFFPLALGVIIVGLGLSIAVPAWLRGSGVPEIDVRSLLVITLSILSFALMIGPFGIIPATFVLIVIGSRANSRLSVPAAILLAAGLSSACALIFKVGLGMPVAVVGWPW